MSKRFDPYCEWLKIPAGQRPPDHYELLGVDRFESNQVLIKSAAKARRLLLEKLVNGRHGAIASSVIEEVAQAYQVLSRPKKKAAYDHQLRELLSAGQTRKSFETFVESGYLKGDSDSSLSAVAGNSHVQREPMGQTQHKKSIQNRDFPIVTVLICMGLVTIVAAIGLFVLITNLAVRPVESDVAQMQPAVAKDRSADSAAPPVVATESEPADRVDLEPPDESTDNRVERVQVDEPVLAATDSPPVTPPARSESDGINPSELAKWKSMLGLKATLEGVVLKEGESGSGKTRYLWFSTDRDNVAMVFMLTRDIGDELSLDFLRSLTGKKIRVTGTVEEQFGTKRTGVRIRSQNQIEIVE